MAAKKPIFWHVPVGKCDLCDTPLHDVMYDSNTRHGWGNVCGECFENYGQGLGTGRGQRYEKQTNGRWLKTDG